MSYTFYKKDDKHYAKKDGINYQGYFVGKLPKTFGVKKIKDYDDEGNVIYKSGKYEWFNCKGLTYIEIEEGWWTYLK